MPMLLDDEQKSNIDNGYQEGNGAYKPSSLQDSEKAAFNNIVDNFDDTADSSKEDSNILRARESQQPEAGWNTNVSGNNTEQPKKFGDKVKGIFKRRGATVSIATLLAGGGSFLILSFAPGLALIDAKETAMDDLNDILTSQDTRAIHVFKTQLKDSTSGVCGSVVNIRCKFSSLSEKQMTKFKNAGITFVDADGKELTKNILGRYTGAAKMNFPGGESVDAKGLQSTLRNTASLRSALNKAYNPRYASFSDKVSQNLYRKLGISRATSFEGNTKDERDKSVRDKVKNGVQEANIGRATQEKDKDGNTIYKDAEGNTITAEQAADGDKFAQNLSTGVEEVTSTGEKATTRFGKLKSVSLGAFGVAGVADTACSIFNMMRAVSTAAKTIRSLQLIRFAWLFWVLADSIKAGKATAEQVDYAMTRLSATDDRDTVVDPVTGQDVANPNKGKNAFDSEGMKLVKYGDVPQLSLESSQFMVGGTIFIGVLEGITGWIKSTVGNPRSTCKVIQSWWARSLSLIGGVILAIGTLGIGTAITAGVGIGIGLFVVPYLQAMLTDMAAGQSVDEVGYQAGNAITSGTGQLNAAVSQAHGLQPLTKSEIGTYMASSADTKQSYIAAETYDARNEPFNVMNQYSFMGSFARSLLPYSSIQTAGSVLSSAASMFKGSFASLSSLTSAKTVYSPERFEQCKDDDYDEYLNNGNNDSNSLALDVFCNIRYGMTPEELNMDSDVAVDYMITNNYIDEASGNAVSGSDYEKFVTNCSQRANPLGDNGSEEDTGGTDWETGKACLQNGAPYSYFRVYTLDRSIIGSMEGEDDVLANGSTTDANTPGSAQATAERPANTSNKGSGWDLTDGQDYSAVACAPGTTDYGIVKHPVKNFTIRLCSLGTMKISSLISLNLKNMVTDAQAAGVTLTGYAYRSYQEQIRTRIANGCDDPGGTSSSGCSPPTASPGTSMHERGLAIDFSQGGGSIGSGSAEFKWLQANAAKYGFINYSVEPWHWSTSGT